MNQNLSQLVEGCIDTHVTASSTRDARTNFRALITHAYELGAKDAHEEITSRENRSVQKEVHQGQAKGQSEGREKSDQANVRQKEGVSVDQATNRTVLSTSELAVQKAALAKL